MRTDHNINGLISPGLSPEMELLLLLCPQVISEENLGEIRHLVKKIDWDLFLKLVQRHRVLSLVCHNIKKISRKDRLNNSIKNTASYQTKSASNADLVFDADFVDKLNDHGQKYTVKALKLTSALLNMMELFQENNIKAISLKGPPSSYHIYNDLSLRNCADLDILVAHQDMINAHAVLVANGYKNKEEFRDLSDKQKNALFRDVHHLSYMKQGVVIELHQSYYKKEYINRHFDEIWKNTKKMNIQGRLVNVLDDEENFVYLIMHGSKHAWRRLKWLCDIYELARRGGYDWQAIARRTKDLNIEHTLAQTMVMLQMLFSFPVPPELMTLVQRNKLAQKLANMAVTALTEVNELQDNTAGQSLLFYKYHFVMLQGFSNKIKHLLSKFRPQLIDFQSVKFHDRFYFLYYCYRPIYKIMRVVFER